VLLDTMPEEPVPWERAARAVRGRFP
jgi:hypothetical protein